MPAFLNDRSAAAEIGISHDKVRQLRISGALAFTQEGRSILIPRAAVEEYIAAKHAAAHDESLRRRRVVGQVDPANAPYMDLIFGTKKPRRSRTSTGRSEGDQ